VALALRAGADVAARAPGSGETALGLAAQAGDLPTVAALVAAGADLVRSLAPWLPTWEDGLSLCVFANL